MGFLGVSSGSTFNPSRSLSRLDVLVALTSGMNYSFSGSTDTVLSLYSDATTIPTNVRSLIAAATQRGIVVNYPNVKSLSLNTVATRADVAAFIYQTLVSTGEVTAISSPYVVGGELGTLELNQTETEVNQTQTEVNQTQTEVNQTQTEVNQTETEVNQTETEVNQTQTETEVEGDRNKPRQNCNQGIGNGAEGCDPGNSRPRGGSNDEGGRTPGNRP
jgi:outer membrane murein-binding lipoprotein Lpp